MENKQRPVIQETKELVQKYHVLEKAQLYAYFALDKRDHFVGKAFKVLEKERLIYIHPKLEVVAANEEAFARKDIGTMKAFWVLLDIMKQKTVEEHFPASKEEYPVRIVFYGSGEIYDILYVTEAEITVVNNLFSRKEIDGCGHIVVVEKPEEIPKIRISDTIGFCTVKEGGEVEYYRHCSQDRDGYGWE